MSKKRKKPKPTHAKQGAASARAGREAPSSSRASRRGKKDKEKAKPNGKSKGKARKEAEAKAEPRPTKARRAAARRGRKAEPRRGEAPREVGQIGSPEAGRRFESTEPPASPDDPLDADLAAEEAPELGLGSRAIAPNVRFEPEPPMSDREPEPPRSGPPPDVEAQIRALEARLDGLIRRAAVPNDEPPASFREQVEDAAFGVVERMTSRPRGNPGSGLDPVAAEYVERQWGREALRSRSEEFDDFGLDPTFEKRVRPAFDLLYRRYFRVEVEGIERVPSAGRAVIIANHGGTLPLDGAMLRTAMRLDHPSGRDLRWLTEDFVFYLPFAGVFLNRIGAVRACPENAERLLEKDALIAVFPEGVHGIKKLFRERYRLQRFGRGGYIRLCLRTRAPLVPCAIIGAEETNPLLYRLESVSELFRLPYLPVTPTFPLLGPMGLLPAPTRWKLKFGEPISFDHYGPEAADDHVLVGRLSERVRAAIQGLLDSGLRERKSVWFG